ncbi:uncharacterized protein C12orf40 homolog isoform X6 [Hyla sarda]|uniref:uncharacterized protein C12orf40 homolog isoform X6 n=1 Tax=Hyla sarda TaxID=327740 RepID=UPI0024C27130|nr:uncharacterized protein C12orf40 homolog isoform X6 [Hyla sarda]
MNWVGGSRDWLQRKKNHMPLNCTLTNARSLTNKTDELEWLMSEEDYDIEFFQKKKMKSKLKLLESSYPTQASLSLDVLNLHIINQISKKKERSKHLDMGERNETFSNLRKNVQLPMSPINIPSKLCLDDPEAISLQAEAFECRTDQNLQSITKQDKSQRGGGEMEMRSSWRRECFARHRERSADRLPPDYGLKTLGLKWLFEIFVKINAVADPQLSSKRLMVVSVFL